MNQIWQMWSGVLEDSVVESIITECDKFPIETASLGVDGSTPNDQYRKSKIRWINSNNPVVSDMLWDYSRAANRNAFGFNIDYIKDIQYTTYTSADKGKYDWHHDTFWGNSTMYDRKISIIIQLTDPSEYEGGEFEMDYQYEQPNKEDLKKKGTIIVFPSFIPHRVTELTKGTRKSLVAWVEGPKFV